MKVEITYPTMQKQKTQRHDVINWVRWPFLFAAYICPILNICVGGRAWSLVVLWSMWIVWSFVFSKDLVEYNRISQSIKLVANTSVLLVLIDVFLAPGWAMEVVPIVCFCGLAVAGILLFTDFDRQKQNMSPMLLMIAAAIACSVVGLIFWSEESRWALVVMGAFAFALFATCFILLGNELFRELKKCFHTK